MSARSEGSWRYHGRNGVEHGVPSIKHYHRAGEDRAVCGAWFHLITKLARHGSRRVPQCRRCAQWEARNVEPVVYSHGVEGALDLGFVVTDTGGNCKALARLVGPEQSPYSCLIYVTQLEESNLPYRRDYEIGVYRDNEGSPSDDHVFLLKSSRCPLSLADAACVVLAFVEARLEESDERLAQVLRSVVEDAVKEQGLAGEICPHGLAADYDCESCIDEAVSANHRAGNHKGADRLEGCPLCEASECLGHPAGPSDPLGVTVYCDGSCREVK